MGSPRFVSGAEPATTPARKNRVIIHEVSTFISANCRLRFRHILISGNNAVSRKIGVKFKVFKGGFKIEQLLSRKKPLLINKISIYYTLSFSLLHLFNVILIHYS